MSEFTPEPAPQRDRRKRRRIITMRNVAWTALVVFVLFAGFSLWHELNPSSDDASALLDTRKQRVEDQVVREQIPYVDTAEVSEHDPREPMWVERPSQEELLGVDPNEQYRSRSSREVEPDSARIDPSPALTPRGADEPFLEQRSDRDTSRIKITGSGTDVKIEKPDE